MGFSFRYFFCAAAACVASEALAADEFTGVTASDIDPAPLAKLEQAIARGDYPNTTSVLIVRDGKLAYEHYFGEGSAAFLNNTRSATKFVTTLALGAAISEAAIPSDHARAFEYLKDLKPFKNDTEDKEAITLQDMLSMSSALACDDGDDDSPGNEDKMHPQPNWTRWAVDLPTQPGYARDGAGLGPFRYCTTNAFLVGQIIQRATHMAVDRFTEDRILRPLGIRNWQWSYSPAKEAMTGGGLELRSRDLAKIAWMTLSAGRWQDKQILPQTWIDAALTVRRASRPNQNYGYFIFEGDFKTACGLRPVWYMAGTGGSQILILRDQGAAIVVTRTAFKLRGTSAQTVDMLEKYILSALPCRTSNWGPGRANFAASCIIAPS
ncbi:MAG TPA: serine hydrolase [Steroidobacteraceae bacterium]|nr:serine hydrolase [Steroidobacteraceae bacterium]